MLVAASAAAHLVRGLDVEEAAVHLGLLVALFRTRRQFVAPGDSTTVRPLVQVAIALGVVPGLLLAELYLTDDTSLRIERGLALAVGALAFRALWLWLRPPGAAPCTPDARERAAAGRQPARGGQPLLLRPAARQGLRLLAQRPFVSRLSRRRRHRADCGRPDRRSLGAARADRRVRARCAREGVARRGRGCRRRGARGLRGARVQVALPRRRGGHPAVGVLAGRTGDPQGAAVRVPSREERLRGPCPLGGRRRRDAAPRARVRVAGVARQLAGARLHDGDGRIVRLSRHRARRRRRAPAGRSVASCSSCPLRRATATRSRRCGAAATRPMG